jgi:predicted PurR-regulated permease PerM
MNGTKPSRLEIASWILAGVSLLLVLWLHLLVALLAGLTVFELVHILAPRLQRHFVGRPARVLAVVLLSMLIIGLLIAAIVGLIAFFRGQGGLDALLHKIATITATHRETLPAWLAGLLPNDAEALRTAMSDWLQEHTPELQIMGKEAGRVIAHLFIGMIIGAILSLREATSEEEHGPLAQALIDRAQRLADSFRRVVFAQVRISAINTAFTAIYLLVALPLFGIHLPFAKTLVGVTFLTGLLPVVGNLISNGIIVVVSISHSLYTALASIAFLVVIHKLEYFLNAKIIGSRIHSRAWELLAAMLVMEAAFGLVGVVAAPIYYAYVKRELADRGLL